ncbi:MAG: hypothetical protein KBA31_09620 [Alphaproteobacteria bacterium]|nr:hypothetical protein [Alphaproteobacteria bacterium]
MPKGHSDPQVELIHHIETARAMLDKALSLVKSNGGPARAGKVVAPPNNDPAADFDISMGLRAFVKKYASGKSGAHKFTLLLAHLAGGEVGKGVPLEEVVKQWNSMTALLGAYNHAHPLRAREADLVESKEGSYLLRSGWKEHL